MPLREEWGEVTGSLGWKDQSVSPCPVLHMAGVRRYQVEERKAVQSKAPAVVSQSRIQSRDSDTAHISSEDRLLKYYSAAAERME